MDEETAADGGDQRRPTGRAGRFEFITFTNPEMARTVDARRRVRSQALRHFHQQSGPSSSRARRNWIELDVSPLLHASSQAQAAISQSATENIQRYPSPVTLLDVSRVDPFFQYPVPMRQRERELYDHRELQELFRRFPGVRLISDQYTMKPV
jgi:hypothetical protein